MRVLQIVHSPDPGGVLALARSIAAELADHGIVVETEFLYKEALPGKLRRVSGTLRLAGRILRGRYDGLIAYQATASLIVGIVGWLTGTRARIVHQTVEPLITAAPIRLMDRLVGTLGVYHANIVNSIWTQSQFAHYPKRYRRSLVLIEHGIAPPALRRGRAEVLRAYEVPDDGPILLNTGRLVEQKNQAVLIRALVDLPGTRLVLAGAGPLLEEYRDVAARLGVADRLHLLGAVPHAEIADLYAAADLFVFPSLHETFGISAVEAVLLRRPAVVAGIAVLREVLTIGGESEVAFVDPHDEAAWRAAIRLMLASPPPVERLSAFADRVADHYSTRRMIGSYTQLLRRFGSGPGGIPVRPLASPLAMETAGSGHEARR